MTTYFIMSSEGRLVGWIDATDEDSAKALAEIHHGKNVCIDTHPSREWYARHEIPVMEEKQNLSFAA